MEEIVVPSGLEGVVVTKTAISDVDGLHGRLTYRGQPIQEIVNGFTWERLLGFLSDASWETTSLGATPSWKINASAANPMALMVIVAQSIPYDADTPLAFIRSLPVSFARSGGVAGDPGEGSLAYRYLTMLRGTTPTDDETRALDTYWMIAAEHSLNASTFAVRIAASTGAALPMAIIAGIGVLSGPLHGGAPTGVLALLEEASQTEDIDALLRTQLDRGERLMGFGHRVYRTMDPRADALKAAFQALASRHERVRLALAVEEAGLRLLQERYPERVLATNVEFYAAALLQTLGIGPLWCPPTFAAGRLAGWTAHYFEQKAQGRLIRPLARYQESTG